MCAQRVVLLCSLYQIYHHLTFIRQPQMMTTLETNSTPFHKLSLQWLWLAMMLQRKAALLVSHNFNTIITRQISPVRSQFRLFDLLFSISILVPRPSFNLFFDCFLSKSIWIELHIRLFAMIGRRFWETWLPSFDHNPDMLQKAVETFACSNKK